MYLTKYEESILEGEEGEVKRVALETIVKVGEVLGATRLVELKKAHISGISYKNIGDEGLDFIRKLSKAGGRFACETTTNPSAIPVGIGTLSIPREFEKKQKEIHSYLNLMGAKLTLSCIPYEYDPPSLGEQIGWGESNAVLYANSILGARTNREAAPLTILEAIVARAPLIDLRTDEGRIPSCIVTLDEKLKSKVKDSTISPSIVGYTIGSIIKVGVPFVEWRPCKYIKEFLAGVGAAGSIGMVYLRGVSPEIRLVSSYLKDLERISIGLEEVKECMEMIAVSLDEADAYLLGCPHLTPLELERILRTSKSVNREIRVILTTSTWVYQKCKRLIGELNKKGYTVLSGTCLIVTPLEYLGIKKIITDSAKAAYYLSSQGIKVALVPREEIIK